MLLKLWCASAALLLAQMGGAQAPVASGGAGPHSTITAALVAATLAEAGLPIAEARLHLPGSLIAHTGAPMLKVTAAEQHANGSLAVRFTCRNSVECMPFFVTVDASDDRSALAAFAAQIPQTQASPSPTASAGIAVGARVTLQLSDTLMRIQLPAIAIDTGAPGAEVRVASLDRKQTWRGIVVDATTVRGGVQ